MDDVEVPQADVAALPTAFDGSALLLDVREHDEWRQGHAADALHIPMGEVPARLGEIDSDATVYVMCHAGGRSQRVAQYLARNGYRAVNISGGILAWSAAGRPIVTDDGGAGAV
ncbi:rhodanese-like domain-containing protein [Mycobacterium sp. GA-2829]|uniref:rhodanese-like domain-containing protein n=1 Tax=Mycobacterium sp. GA-2829 TaxID=1772283 RepID=UPI00073FF5FE|nr:rhodanese-like domain-containing protein [Mycobacterium sp. GA-2829]KUI23565.1 sulfurtransferase [Mycobacterium sp. GA-2829]